MISNEQTEAQLAAIKAVLPECKQLRIYHDVDEDIPFIIAKLWSERYQEHFVTKMWLSDTDILNEPQAIATMLRSYMNASEDDGDMFGVPDYEDQG